MNTPADFAARGRELLAEVNRHEKGTFARQEAERALAKFLSVKEPSPAFDAKMAQTGERE